VERIECEFPEHLPGNRKFRDFQLREVDCPERGKRAKDESMVPFEEDVEAVV
jgi:hypothetical protein